MVNKCVSKTHISPYAQAQLIPGGVVHGPLKGTKHICNQCFYTQVIFGVDLLTFRPDIAYK